MVSRRGTITGSGAAPGVTRVTIPLLSVTTPVVGGGSTDDVSTEENGEWSVHSPTGSVPGMKYSV
jgi:hypothetical protein